MPDRLKTLYNRISSLESAPQVALSAATTIASGAIGIGTIAMLSRSLGPEAFGSYGTILSISSITIRLTLPNPSIWLPALLKEHTTANRPIKPLLHATIAIETVASIITALITLALTRLLAPRIHDLISASEILLLGLATPISLLAGTPLFMRVLKLETSIAARTLLSAIAKLLIVLYALHFQRGSTMVLSLICAVDLTSHAGMVLRCAATLRASPTTSSPTDSPSYPVPPILTHIRIAATSSWWASLSKSLHRDLDILAAYYMIDASTSGVLRLIKSIASTGLRLSDSIYNVLLAKHATASATSLPDAARAAISSAAISLPWVAAAATICSFGTAFGLHRVLGYEYRDTTPNLLFYSLGISIACATVTWQPLILSGPGPRMASQAAIGAILVQAAIIFTLVPWLGASACGLGFLGFYSAWAYLTYRTLSDTCSFKT